MVTCRRRRTSLSVSFPCLVFIRIFGKIVSGVCLLSELSPDFLSGICLTRLCLSRFCPLSGFYRHWSLKEKSCPLSVCSAGQGWDRAFRTITVLVRWRLVTWTTIGHACPTTLTICHSTLMLSWKLFLWQWSSCRRSSEVKSLQAPAPHIYSQYPTTSSRLLKSSVPRPLS